MIDIADIRADIELRQLLAGSIVVDNGDGTTTTLPVYCDGERPNNAAPEDFVEISYNGSPYSVTEGLEVIRGDMAVALYCKLFSDDTVKLNRVRRILSQFANKVNRHTSEHYFYTLDLDMFITPTAADLTSGYSITILNVLWRSK